MSNLRKTKFAIFDKEILPSEKYRLTHPPKKFFDTRKQAHDYAEENGYEHYKIMTW